MSKTKPVCFIACTHGNEPIGKTAVEAISGDPSVGCLFDLVIGNPKALAVGKRFTEVDLNRSAPGKSAGKTYEERRAFELMRAVKPYRYVVDLHETPVNDRIILILMKLNARTLALASAFPVKDVLYWPSSEPKTGPLTQYVSRGLEVESGTKTSFKKTQRKLQKALTAFLANLYSIPESESAFQSKTAIPKGKRFFHVYAKIEPGDVADPSKLKDFGHVRTSKESFVSILFGKHAGLIGYKMKPIDAKWIAAHREP